MMTEDSEQMQYHSLADIRLRKEKLRKEIADDDAKFKTLWNSLFYKPAALQKNASPSKRISSALSLGAGALDGAVLAWKLYRKFKRK